jgi:predicted secreted protein
MTPFAVAAVAGGPDSAEIAVKTETGSVVRGAIDGTEMETDGAAAMKTNAPTKTDDATNVEAMQTDTVSVADGITTRTTLTDGDSRPKRKRARTKEQESFSSAE